MPFKSQAQRGWMYANHPDMAKRWEKHTPKGKLPKHVDEEDDVDSVLAAQSHEEEQHAIDDYEKRAEKVDNPKLKDLFKHTAKDEREHEGEFAQFMGDENDGSIPENPDLPDPDAEGEEYKKTAPVHALKMDEPFDVETIEGPMSGKAGDWLVKGHNGDMWVVDDAMFQDTHEPTGGEQDEGEPMEEEGGKVCTSCDMGYHERCRDEWCACCGKGTSEGMQLGDFYSYKPSIDDAPEVVEPDPLSHEPAPAQPGDLEFTWPEPEGEYRELPSASARKMYPDLWKGEGRTPRLREVFGINELPIPGRPPAGSQVKKPTEWTAMGQVGSQLQKGLDAFKNTGNELTAYDTPDGQTLAFPKETSPGNPVMRADPTKGVWTPVDNEKDKDNPFAPKTQSTMGQ